MPSNRRLSFAGLAVLIVSIAAPLAPAQAPTGAITGIADAGSQIVVTNLDDGQISGVMATCSGSYRASNLKPGKYQIVENGPHHAPRSLTVVSGQDAHVDLAAEPIKKTC